MKPRTSEDEPEPAIPPADGKSTWVDPEVSEPKDLIGYPDGLILQGDSGSTG